ncbi:hypothetical protein AOE01nite_03720 [Acetobacter oeni]|uniref:Uncharacterized protein n=2 Tax=Acetobacter oeni TaxID=304077 RepID=A0A511XGT5_9PROT|nr:hypothetical protein [Acetobacter oeni]MBB3881682.1 putative Zn-dependent protease [Acetobacter oeni]GEN62148.1 hypothetical protein AOE01nite_03720 [Acetobacter oeni]
MLLKAMKPFRLAAFIAVTALSVPVMPACAAPPAPVTAPPHVSQETARQSREKDLVAKLAKARSDAEAGEIRSGLEELRTKPLRPATMLLLRRATRELSEQKAGDAIEDLGAALALQNDVPALWRLRAQARLAGGDTDGAVSDLGIAIQRDPDDALNWQTLTDAEEARSDSQAALRAWQHAMTLDPRLPGADKRLEKLRLKAFGQPT